MVLMGSSDTCPSHIAVLSAIYFCRWNFPFLGEGLKELLPLPIPASIYGLILLFAALELHIMCLEAVRDVGRFLIEIMPLMFIPSAVGLIESWDELKEICIPVIVIMVVSTVVVMAVSGRVTQFVIRKRRKGETR